MAKLLGWILFLIGSWMMVAPQALTGLKQLKWMHNYSFPGEVLLAIPIICLAYYLMGIKPKPGSEKASH